MHIELLDDRLLPWQDLNPTPLASVAADRLDRWFWQWARSRMASDNSEFEGDGLFLLNAHGRFSSGAYRQDLQGIELLKHIRLTPWLGSVRNWHAIVYSFEPLADILARRPGDLILKSPGVTFLRLPGALDLRNALCAAYPRKDWDALNLTQILFDLGKTDRATPGDRSFRPYVASDYHPPDSAHQISNWWGIYEMFLALCNVDHPEYADPRLLPSGVRDFVLRLETKKARWLEGARVASASAREQLRTNLFDHRLDLIKLASGKKVVYVDDEAANGWSNILQSLLNRTGEETCTVTSLDKSLLRLRSPEDRSDKTRYWERLARLAEAISSQNPNLLILDLRLLGPAEAFQDPSQASGMDLAREVRSSNPYLPILLFTASNKAETLLISRSLDLDDYWMKPGLGEHRGLRSREDDLFALVGKLSGLLGKDSLWLQRVAGELRAIEQRRDLHWWEQTISWPGPEYAGAAPTVETQQPDHDIRKRVVSLLHPILYTTRIIFRLNEMFGRTAPNCGKPGSSQYIPPESLPTTLRDALFNQVGQLIELVHNLSRINRSSNGILGGYFEPARAATRYAPARPERFVFRRRDWWAFRLFAFRNQHAHQNVGTAANDHQVKTAISDLFAWLTEERIQVRPQSALAAQAIADAMASTPKLIWRKGGLLEVYPVLRFDFADQQGEIIAANGATVVLATCSNEVAVDSRFREQVAARPEFGPLVKTSDRLLNGS